MCELFGVSSAKRIQVAPYLKVLVSHSTDHPHGWGMASFFFGGVSIEKEPKTAWCSDYVQAHLERNDTAQTAEIFPEVRLLCPQLQV